MQGFKWRIEKKIHILSKLADVIEIINSNIDISLIDTILIQHRDIFLGDQAMDMKAL